MPALGSRAGIAVKSLSAASGSSGGTGSGIAANFATVGIGEDTGGPVRGPAAVNNLVGLRPTLPLVSHFGMMPARPTTDTLGPIARSVKDAAIVLNAIAGYHANDPVMASSWAARSPSRHCSGSRARMSRGRVTANHADHAGTARRSERSVTFDQFTAAALGCRTRVQSSEDGNVE